MNWLSLLKIEVTLTSDWSYVPSLAQPSFHCLFLIPLYIKFNSKRNNNNNCSDLEEFISVSHWSSQRVAGQFCCPQYESFFHFISSYLASIPEVTSLSKMTAAAPAITHTFQPARGACTLPLRIFPRSCTDHFCLHPIGQKLVIWPHLITK